MTPKKDMHGSVIPAKAGIQAWCERINLDYRFRVMTLITISAMMFRFDRH